MYLINQAFVLPILFIVLYGSGFVFTVYGLEHSSPMAFLVIRFFVAFFILLLLAFILKDKWPKNLKEFFHIAIAGSMTVGVFSVAGYIAMANGIDAALAALIISLQPMLVTFLATRFLNEKLTKSIVLGLLIGLAGVFFVLSSKLSLSQIELSSVIFSILSLLGLSFGNLYQKKFCSNMSLFSGGAIQTFCSALLALPLLLFWEEPFINLNIDFVIALSYMIFGVSIGAVSLLYVMIQRGEVSKVSSVFYMIPVSAAVISYLLFDTTIDFTMILGIIAVLIGILLINKK